MNSNELLHFIVQDHLLTWNSPHGDRDLIPKSWGCPLGSEQQKAGIMDDDAENPMTNYPMHPTRAGAHDRHHPATSIESIGDDLWHWAQITIWR